MPLILLGHTVRAQVVNLISFLALATSASLRGSGKPALSGFLPGQILILPAAFNMSGRITKYYGKRKRSTPWTSTYTKRPKVVPVPRRTPSNTSVTSSDTTMVYKGANVLRSTAGALAINAGFIPTAFFSQEQIALVNSFAQTKLMYLVVKTQNIHTGNARTAVSSNTVALGLLDSAVTVQNLNELLDKCPSAKPISAGAVNFQGMGSKCLFKPIQNTEKSFLVANTWLNTEFCRMAWGFADDFLDDTAVLFTWYLKCVHKRN